MRHNDNDNLGSSFNFGLFNADKPTSFKKDFRFFNNDSKQHRRRFLQRGIAATVAVACVSQHLNISQAAPKSVKVQERVTRVKSVLEVRGEVRLKKTNEEKETVRTAPIESKTTLQFEERFAVAPQFAQAALYFQVAEGSITVENHATDVRLRDDTKTMIRWTNEEESTIHTAGVETPLRESEKKLSESPLVSMYLESLIPAKSAKIGERTTLDQIAAAKLLGLEAIQSGAFVVTLLSQDENVRQLELEAELSASVNAVPTKIKLSGKASHHLESDLINYVAVNIQEERDIGFAEPGFNVTARLRLIREELDQTKSLKTLEDYTAVFEKNQEEQLQLFESTEGGYRFLAPADWVVYKDGEIDSLLRLVKSNRALAQCNIVNLADMEPGRQLKLDAFKLDVQRVLGGAFGRLAEESERVTKKNLRMMRVVATGNVSDVDVIWINLLISNDEGRHVSIVFTTNADRMGDLGDADQRFVDTFEFTRRLKSKEDLAKSTDQSQKK